MFCCDPRRQCFRQTNKVTFLAVVFFLSSQEFSARLRLTLRGPAHVKFRALPCHSSASRWLRTVAALVSHQSAGSVLAHMQTARSMKGEAATARTVHLLIQRIVDCISDLGRTSSRAAKFWKAMWSMQMPKSDNAATMRGQRCAGNA